MHISLEDSALTELERHKLNKLLERESENVKTDLEQMWFLMDLVWDDFRCDNSNLLSNKPVTQFSDDITENAIAMSRIKRFLLSKKKSFFERVINKIFRMCGHSR